MSSPTSLTKIRPTKISKKSIETLVDDIYELIGSDNIVDLSPELLEELGLDIQELMKTRLSTERGAPRLRLSASGKPARQLWYEVKQLPEINKEKLSSPTFIKFLFGDLWELVILFLAESAGHEVTHKQAEVEVAGVKGHCDAIIDGVVVDVKSASHYAFRKFENGTLAENDAFGYMEQLASYCTAFGGLDGAFLAVDKQTGKLTLMQVPFEELAQCDIEERLEHLKEVLDSDEVPDKCYHPVPHGKSGNEVLGVNCSYCPFKQSCWADANDGMGLRTFIYSNGPVHFTNVAKEPQVFEVTI